MYFSGRNYGIDKSHPWTFLNVTAGRVRSDSLEPYSERRSVVDVQCHPRYNRSITGREQTRFYDIAVMYFKPSIRFTAYIKPVDAIQKRKPSSLTFPDTPQNVPPCVLHGFGMTGYHVNYSARPPVLSNHCRNLLQILLISCLGPLAPFLKICTFFLR